MGSTRPYDYVKRVLDLGLSAVGLVVLSPVLLFTAVAVRFKLGSPVLFTQQRPGRFGKPFVMVKFRTMREGIGPDAERLTSFGQLLRRTSLDELPELWNVLRGDMSLVGPRPLLMSYMERYDENQRRRHDVRPGITGLAQVSGRNLVDWPERFKIDVDYVDQRSLRLDCIILIRTVLGVVKADGISSTESSTMTEFLGNVEPGDSTCSGAEPDRSIADR